MIARLDLVPYRLGLRRPWASARGTLGERRGWLVRAATRHHRGFGDCAPLPAAGTEPAGVALAALSDWQRSLVGQSLEAALTRLEQEPAPDQGEAPAARFAVECALRDLVSHAHGLPLRHQLATASWDRVEVNAMLGPLEAETHGRAEQAWRAGFRVLKVKVGLAAPETEAAALRQLATGLPPDVALRLDANGAWDLDGAACLIAAIADLPIEALEEPLTRPQCQTLRALQSLAPFPLALDESLHRSAAAEDLAGGLIGDPAALGVRRWVLKPAAVGGLRATLALAERAHAAGVEVVVTSLIESAAGLWPTLQLAAALPGQAAHGLATSSWLDRDLGAPPIVQAGQVLLPARPGSGFEPSAAPAGTAAAT